MKNQKPHQPDFLVVMTSTWIYLIYLLNVKDHYYHCHYHHHQKCLYIFDKISKLKILTFLNKPNRFSWYDVISTLINNFTSIHNPIFGLVFTIGIALKPLPSTIEYWIKLRPHIIRSLIKGITRIWYHSTFQMRPMWHYTEKSEWPIVTVRK